MSEDTADIVGTIDANFTVKIDSATIVTAFLMVKGQPNLPLAILGNKREVTVPDLPAGDSTVRLDLFWAPGDPDATIDVGTVNSGVAQAIPPKQTIDRGQSPGFALLFGK
jgi:hypothetical protein